MTIDNKEKLQQAFNFTKIFRKTFKISFIEFLINSIMSYILKGKSRTKPRFYYLKLFILAEAYCLMITISHRPPVSNDNYTLFTVFQFIVLMFMILIVYVFNSTTYTYSSFTVDTDTDESKNKEKLNISMLRLIFQVSFLSSNLIERDESGEFVLKKSKLKAVENFMIDLQSVFNTDYFNMHIFNKLKNSIKNSIIDNTKDKVGVLYETTKFIEDSNIFDFINYCIYAEIIYLNFGNMLIKHYPNADYDTDTLLIGKDGERKLYCDIDFSDEIVSDVNPKLKGGKDLSYQSYCVDQLNVSDNNNDKWYFIRTAFGNFVSLYSNKFYSKYKSIYTIMIKWIDSYDFYTYDNDKNVKDKNICINIPYDPLNVVNIVDNYLIGRVERRRKHFDKKINKRAARILKQKQKMKHKNWDNVTFEELIG